MSKWSLLFRKPSDIKPNEAKLSIHRHQGFEVFQKKKVLWMGWRVHTKLDLNKRNSKQQSCETIDKILNECYRYMVVVDCAELQLYIHGAYCHEGNGDLESNFSELVSMLQKYEEDGMLRIRNINYDNGSTEYQRSIDVVVTHRTLSPLMSSCQFFCYDVPNIPATDQLKDKNGTTRYKIYTRENMENNGARKINAKQLSSHVSYGVDNTGNVCVWKAESVLLYYLTNNRKRWDSLKGKRILEIGGGLSGLCGLSLWRLQMKSHTHTPPPSEIEATGQEHQHSIDVCDVEGASCNSGEIVVTIDVCDVEGASCNSGEIVVTDGNPECVSNMRVCYEMNRQMMSIKNDMVNTTGVDGLDDGARAVIARGDGSAFLTDGQPNVPISFKRLRWNRKDEYGEMRSIIGESTNTSNTFDVILGADCLFFKEFHLDLCWCIWYALCGWGSGNDSEGRRGDNDGGVNGNKEKVVYLMQPRRGNTLQLFLDCISSHELFSQAFHVTVTEDFDKQITALHWEYMKAIGESHGHYDPDIHRPILVTISICT